MKFADQCAFVDGIPPKVAPKIREHSASTAMPDPTPDNIDTDQNLPDEPQFKPTPMQAGVGLPPESLFGRRLAAVRGHYRMSIEALCRLIKDYDSAGKGISPPSYARYESGENLPGVREVRLLCDALDVPPKWLIYGEIDAAGKSEGEQLVLTGLRKMMAESQPDFIVGGATADSIVDFHRNRDRARRLAEARKPSQ